MTLKQLLEFIDKRYLILKKHYGESLGGDKEILAGVAKVIEETGEMAEAVLAQMSLQRREKIEHLTQKDVEEEVADVLITTLILAKSIDMDVVSALQRKMKKIESR